jgi:hypothetical protein
MYYSQNWTQEEAADELSFFQVNRLRKSSMSRCPVTRVSDS